MLCKCSGGKHHVVARGDDLRTQGLQGFGSVRKAPEVKTVTRATDAVQVGGGVPCSCAQTDLRTQGL
jgi:hypothetical protein